MNSLPSITSGEADRSLVRGGPLYQLFLHCRLSREPIDIPHQRTMALVLFTWLPMAVMAVATGHAIGGSGVPFLQHLGVHARFLAALPLLIVAEVFVHERIQLTIAEFSGRGLISPRDQPRFDQALKSALALRNSVALEMFMLLLAFTAGHFVWQSQTSLHADCWYRHVGKPGASLLSTLRPAGYWYAFVALPIFRFLLLRWYIRLFIWYLFMWKVSRIPLRLNALHPDQAGGLEFLTVSITAFAPVLLAHTVGLAGVSADRIWHEGARLQQFKLELAGIVLLLILLVIFPLTFFTLQLERARRAAAREYGRVGMDYVNAFREKWLKHQAAPDEPMLGSADIQSLADLGNSFEIVRGMKIVPFNRLAVLRLASLLVLPLLPLSLTVIPLGDIVDRGLQMLL